VVRDQHEDLVLFSADDLKVIGGRVVYWHSHLGESVEALLVMTYPNLDVGLRNGLRNVHELLRNVDMISTREHFLLLVEEIKFVKIDLSIVWEGSLGLGVLVSVENSRLDVIFTINRFDIMINDRIILLSCFGVSPLDIVDVILNKFE